MIGHTNHKKPTTKPVIVMWSLFIILMLLSHIILQYVGVIFHRKFGNYIPEPEY